MNRFSSDIVSNSNVLLVYLFVISVYVVYLINTFLNRFIFSIR